MSPSEVLDYLDRDLFGAYLVRPTFGPTEPKPDPVRLASLVLSASPLWLADAISYAAGHVLVEAEVDEVRELLQCVALLIVATTTDRAPLPADRTDADGPGACGPSSPGRRRGLVIDPELAARLPLLSFARDLARLVGCVEVATGPLADDQGGFCARHVPGVVLIGLDVAKLGTDGPALADAWAHELAHALDPDPFAALPTSELERFANTLGPLLLAAEPATVDEAALLVDQATTATRPALVAGMLAAFTWLAGDRAEG